MTRKKKIFAGVILALIFLGGFIGWKLFGPATSTKNGEFFYVKTGSVYADVKKELIQKKYIPNERWFDLATKLLRYKTIKPGRYKISKGMSLIKLVRMLRGGNQSQVTLVITKIRTKEDFARKTGVLFEFDSVQMIRFLNNTDSLKKFGLDSNTVIAGIMPYTYNLNWNSSPDKVFQKIYTAFETFWTKERKVKADSLHLTRIEVSALASIVEEETNKKEDKYKIASTYLNRIRTGMKLQADPTVKFALKNFALKRITGAHLITDSPYNTYLYTGIPPGPICTPSVESIEAVLNAPRTDYLYFVASHKFDGTSVFTSKYNDHMKFARLYQQELTRRMDSASKAKNIKALQ
ncbi:MAG: endolytic transglycosylase MltG [Chitinophagaceae bacterium]|nr:endolytic transglycosylase MltG [Chitinophagaceae bacterium]